MRLLLVEDDPGMVEMLGHSLRKQGYAVDNAATGEDALWKAREYSYDAVVLDLMIPSPDGFEVCRRMREEGRWAPVIMLTARDAVADRIRGLDVGADDYLTKPFGSMELVARVRAHLRRVASVESEAPVLIRAGDVEIDFHRRGAFRNGERIHLTPLEWSLLRTMASQAGRTLTHRQLFDAVWARSHGNASQYLRVFITALRKKIEPDSSAPQLIVTEPGVGYRFEIPRAT